MKASFLFLILFSLHLFSCSQDISADKVPSVVQNTVQARFAGAGKIEWEKKKQIYEAEFDIDSSEYAAHLDAAGHLLLYKMDIKTSQLPGIVLSVIQRDYPGYKIDEAEQLNKDGMIYYQAELETRGGKSKKIVFAENGTIATHLNYMD